MPIFWILLASLAFACMGVCIKLASADIMAAEAVFYRGVIAWLLSQAYVVLQGHTLRTPHLRAHLLRAGVGCCGMGTYFSAITMIPLATAVTLAYTSPLFMALILWLWYREPVRPMTAAALVLGFGGIVLLLHPTLAHNQWLGAGVGLGAGVFAALAVLNVRKLGQLGEPEWRTVYYFSACSALLGLVWTLAQGGFHPLTGRLAWLALGMGGFGFIGQITMTLAFGRGRPLTMANLSYSTVVFASLFGIFFWGEVLPPQAWLGMGLILLSSMVTTALSRRPPAPVEPD
ncbi:MAG: DMT family transporter [Rhodocyclaceae bacterium]|nr:MAG: DMT family transporter [Rhodocyclaceae bacterium]